MSDLQAGGLYSFNKTGYFTGLFTDYLLYCPDGFAILSVDKGVN